MTPPPPINIMSTHTQMCGPDTPDVMDVCVYFHV